MGPDDLSWLSTCLCCCTSYPSLYIWETGLERSRYRPRPQEVVRVLKTRESSSLLGRGSTPSLRFPLVMRGVKILEDCCPPLSIWGHFPLLIITCAQAHSLTLEFSYGELGGAVKKEPTPGK